MRWRVSVMMMHKLQKKKPDGVRGSSAEPMGEGISKTSRGREWNRMSDDELVELAKNFISEKTIGGRKGLQKADLGLYGALRRRKLLDRAFSDIESSKHAEAVQGVLDALESFGDSDA